MKNLFAYFFLFSLLIFVNSCEKNEESLIKPNSENNLETLFQNDYLSVYKLTPENSLIDFFKNDINSTHLKSAKSSKFDFENTLKYAYEFTSIEIYFIPFISNKNNNLVIFKKDESIFYSLAYYSQFENVSIYNLNTLEDDELYSLTISNLEEQIIDGIKYKEAEILKNFIAECQNIDIKSAQLTCNERSDSFYECMSCSWKELTNDFVGAAACGLAPQSCLTASTIHCLL